MSADFEYAEACLPDRWRVLGRQLLPFSVGHNLLLERIQSPFAIGGKLQIEDLIIAVAICERTFEAGSELLLQGNTLSLRMFSIGVLMRAAIQKNLFEKHATAFSDYTQRAIQKPKGIRTDAEAKITYAPALLVLIRDLTNHFRYSFSEIMDMPMRRAVFERYSILEKDRTISWPEPWEKGFK